jgi:hypothetical protein
MNYRACGAWALSLLVSGMLAACAKSDHVLGDVGLAGQAGQRDSGGGQEGGSDTADGEAGGNAGAETTGGSTATTAPENDAGDDGASGNGAGTGGTGRGTSGAGATAGGRSGGIGGTAGGPSGGTAGGPSGGGPSGGTAGGPSGGGPSGGTAGGPSGGGPSGGGPSGGTGGGAVACNVETPLEDLPCSDCGTTEPGAEGCNSTSAHLGGDDYGFDRDALDPNVTYPYGCRVYLPCILIPFYCVYAATECACGRAEDGGGQWSCAL